MDEGRVDLFWLPLGAGGHLNGVEVTPTLVLVDADGFPLARPRIDLDDGPGTAQRILAVVRKSTGRR